MAGKRMNFLEGSPRLSSCITMRHSVIDMNEVDQWSIIPCLPEAAEVNSVLIELAIGV